MDQFPRIQNGILVFSVHHAQERSHSHPPPPTQSRIHPVLSPSPSIIVRRTTTTRRRRREEGGRVRHDVRRSPGIVFIYLLIFADVCRDPVQADGHPVAYMAGRSNQTDFHASSSITHASSSLSQEVTHSNLKLETRLWVNCEEVPGGSSFPMGASPRIFNPSGPFQPCIQLSSPQPWCEYGGSIGRELPL